ncbi:MAG TPA: DUF5655 domain-containing protein [Acidimicrobiales bacterium]
MAWTCPDCDRRFRRRQRHECSPAMTVEEYFATGPPHERPVFDAVMAHVDTLPDVHVEPLSVGIYLKRAQTFAVLTPKTRWVALGFSLPRVETGVRIARKVEPAGPRWWHTVNLRGPGDVDDQVRDWLTEAYLSSPT